MVGEDEEAHAMFDARVADLADAHVRVCRGLHCLVHHAGVADHVGRREVADEQCVFACLDLTHHSVRYRLRSHLGLEVVGGHLGRLLEFALLALKGLLAATIEEEGDVGKLLGLGGVELGETLLGYGLTEPVGQLLRRKDDRRFEGRAVLCHLQTHFWLARVGRLKLWLDGDALKHLTSAVRAIVEAHEHVVIRDATIGQQALWFDELVLLTGSIFGLNNGLDAPGSDRLALARRPADNVVRLLHALPALVTVHGVVATRDGRDLTMSNLGELLLQRFDVAST
mmetsp:Transcript_76106/g.150867  ORF Transcript_76106/g.150867 Transcript_76106/m.150867 type:complete len:283 (+) Transcript_76106:557-1405(+)